jgi:hypothetical protein
VLLAAAKILAFKVGPSIVGLVGLVGPVGLVGLVSLVGLVGPPAFLAHLLCCVSAPIVALNEVFSLPTKYDMSNPVYLNIYGVCN